MTSRLLRKLAATIKRRTGANRNALDLLTFETFQDLHGRSWELLANYRNKIKSRWEFYYWPVRVLIELDQRGALPDSLQSLRDEFNNIRTLPMPADEVAERLHKVLTCSKDVKHSDLQAEYSKLNAIAVKPLDTEVLSIRQKSTQTCQFALGRVAATGNKITRGRALEVGAGSGYSCYSLAELGFKHVNGIDIEPAFYPMIAEQPCVLSAYRSHNPNISKQVILESGDCHELPYDDNSFDFVYSNSVLEHVRDVSRAMKELARVTKPGGIAYHSVQPWFEPAGGHSLCTTDFPWGHVILGESDFESYVKMIRPHETVAAMQFYRGGFQKPRLTLLEFERAVLDTGLEILDWKEDHQTNVDHYPLLTNELLSICIQHYRHVSMRDLIGRGLRVILRAR